MSLPDSTRDRYRVQLAEAAGIWIDLGVSVVPTGGYPPNMAANQTLVKGWPMNPLRSVADFWARVDDPTSDFDIRGIAAIHGKDFGTFAVDVDGEEGRRHFRWLEANGMIRTRELVTDTPNGLHIVMRRDESALATRFAKSEECAGCIVLGGGFVGPEGDGRLHATTRGKRGPQVTKLAPTRRPITGERYVARQGYSWDPLPLWSWFVGQARPEPKPFVVVPAPGTKAAYGATAFNGELQAILRAHDGRNNQLNASAFSLGTLVAVGVLDAVEVARGLWMAAEAVGLVAEDGEASVLATIESGLTNGVAHPREVAL